MGIVKISDLMHDNLRHASDALSRSINAQAEHWMRVGMLCELHPELSYGDICQLMLRAARTGAEELSFVRPEVAAAATLSAGKAIRKAAR
jgi:tRNA1(Val) A37 N6-methylase TrmN6